MSRELSGVIACMQEIEIAAAELKKSHGPEAGPFLEDLKGMLRAFFQAPGRESAYKIQKTLQAGTQNPALSWMQAPLLVDGLQTSLTGLTHELTEVLEDLG